jgi:hypothetical protein
MLSAAGAAIAVTMPMSTPSCSNRGPYVRKCTHSALHAHKLAATWQCCFMQVLKVCATLYHQGIVMACDVIRNVPQCALLEY